MSVEEPTTGKKPTAKLKIISMEAGHLTVQASYNPKEVSVDKSVPWSKHKDSKTDQPHLEFTGAEPMSMSFEMLFDGAELGTGGSVQGSIDNLLTMAKILTDKKRPHQVRVIWGAGTETKVLPQFTGVIESVSTKYQMFLDDGTPVRATCNIKLKEASTLSFKK
jgi:hypothetical protein